MNVQAVNIIAQILGNNITNLIGQYEWQRLLIHYPRRPIRAAPLVYVIGRGKSQLERVSLGAQLFCVGGV